MNNLVEWSRNPWSVFDELESLQEDVDRALYGAFRTGPRRTRTGYPPMNVWSSDDGVIVDVELPGVDPGDVEITVIGNELTLKGTLNSVKPAEGETTHRRERPSGEFTRALRLPFRIEAGKVSATSGEGLLRLTVPRAEDEKPRKIKVKAA